MRSIDYQVVIQIRKLFHCGIWGWYQLHSYGQYDIIWLLILVLLLKTMPIDTHFLNAIIACAFSASSFDMILNQIPRLCKWIFNHLLIHILDQHNIFACCIHFITFCLKKTHSYKIMYTLSNMAVERNHCHPLCHPLYNISCKSMERLPTYQHRRPLHPVNTTLTIPCCCLSMATVPPSVSNAVS